MSHTGRPLPLLASRFHPERFQPSSTYLPQSTLEELTPILQKAAPGRWMELILKKNRAAAVDQEACEDAVVDRKDDVHS